MKKMLAGTVATFLLFAVACTNNDTNNNKVQENEANAETPETLIVETSAGNITEDEFLEALKDLYGKSVLNDLVEQKIIEAEAEALGIEEEEVQEEIDVLQENMGAQSDDDFYTFMLSQGVRNENDLRHRILSHLVLQHHIGHVGDFTEEDIQDEYKRGEQVEVRHILVSDEETAFEIFQRIQEGEAFPDLAEDYSEDPGSRGDGGNLGFFKRGTMNPSFEEAAFSLEIGDVSEPVLSRNGYHIIEVTDRTEYEEGLEEVKDQLRTALNERKLHKMNEKQMEIFNDVEVNVLEEQFSPLPRFEQ